MTTGYLYIVRSGRTYEERCGRVSAVTATSISSELYYVSVRRIDKTVTSYTDVERFSVRNQ